MARTMTRYMCRDCGATHPKWMGRCPDCGAWDALEEFREAKDEHRTSLSATSGGGTGGTGGPGGPRAEPITTLAARGGAEPANDARLATGIGELDRVLGGTPGTPGTAGSGQLQKGKAGAAGLVRGSAVLIGGDPGIGKSTLMLQAAQRLAHAGRKVLYVTSEESAQQLRLRAERLREQDDDSDNLYVLADTNLARVVEQARVVAPDVMVVDSVQMIYKGDLPAAPGSVTQLRACCLELVYFAKASGCAVIFVGHVTKEGRLAGPKLLEHMVDTVLYFEGDRYHSHRVIRAIKNRFGTTLEVGLFEMTDAGLREVTDGAGLLAAEYRAMSGSVVCPVLQGSRCLLVEIQALTATGFLGSAKRKVSGLDSNRLAMLIAVLEKRSGARLADQDVFASSVGGMKIAEPAADVAVALAIAGAHYNRSLSPGMCAIGEIGLGGEVRHVQQIDQRVREASRLGFKQIICPPTNFKPPAGCELLTVTKVDEAIQMLG